MQPNQIFENQKAYLDQYQNDELSLDQSDHFILTFFVGNSQFAIDFDCVKEVINYFEPSPYPFKIQRHIGIINLRGSVIPIVDPFSDSNIEDISTQSKIIVFETKEHLPVGFIVKDVKKKGIEREKIGNIEEEKVLSIDNIPIRYVHLESLLKNFVEVK